MNKQELIDSFINERKGIPPAGASIFKVNGVEFTLDVFELRAKELGWINGYKWGVEYQTNGKKPDLPDDVLVEFKSERLIGWNKTSVGYVDWVFTTEFRIVDERHKPKDQPMFINFTVDRRMKDGIVISSDNSWHARGERPPVGVECEVLNSALDNAEWERCVVKFIGDLVCVYTSESCNERCAHLDFIKFRPIKTEREKFVEAALEIADRSTNYTATFKQMYDAGFRAPD